MADCEWNPAEKRPAFSDDPPHGEATWCIGVDGKWHLCEACAALPEFSRYRNRVRLKRRVPPRTQRRANRQARVVDSAPICMFCDGTGWCEGSPSFTCPRCKGSGAALLPGQGQHEGKTDR